ncbi:MAG TPA: GNAT family N-acetyltransferase [Bosea sp. (in: a-proteobacteria)]|jgi:acetyltransferase|uniref:bifunctional acetate--CoA ligase family protein/GNAT family N-acetyltransferase n=1 Tax=Bosea sp. (in: a-proteobacteria) TaxID=1871050 RepID=UPI002E166F05|nr:GNAT family N-acetyltransferase [Bosea sp. (in: a-proteobacteria)]
MAPDRLKRMLEPTSVALLARPGDPPTPLSRSIRTGGYAGRLFEAATVEDLPEPVDLIIAPASDASVTIVAAGRRGCAGVLIVDGERAGAGVLGEAARAAGVRLIGPDSLGLVAPRLHLNASFAPVVPKAGNVALIAQSSSIAAGILAWAARRDVGFSGAVTLGAAVDVDLADCLDHFGLDGRTRSILLALDEVEDAARFLSSARAAARLKPVLVLKPWQTPAGKTALTHAGLIVTGDRAHDAAFHRAGLLRVNDLDELFAAAETLGRTRPLAGGRLALVSNGSGLAALAASRLRQLGGALATRTGTAEGSLEEAIIEAQTPADYGRAVTGLLEDGDVDAVLAVHAPHLLAESDACAEAVVEAAREAGRFKPVLAAWIGGGGTIAARFASAGLPSFATGAEAVVGFQHLLRHARLQGELMATPPSSEDMPQPDLALARAIVAKALAERRDWLDPDEVSALLAIYRIPELKPVVAADIEAALAVARPLLARGRPVALKIVSPDIIHKSDVGGVALDLATEAAIREAAERMLARVSSDRPQARITGLAVQPMAQRAKARELIVGFATDPCFGPVVVFGRGGIAAELIDDSHAALPPLDLGLASRLIARTRVSRVLAAYRDVPAARLDAVAATLVAVGQIAVDLPEIRELDLNPLLADEAGVIAVDARIMLERVPQRRRRPAIRPYPGNWHRQVKLRGGLGFSVRPIRPEDEEAIAAMLQRVTQEDLRLRFFAPLKTFSHAFLAHLTQLDYARAMAFVAFEDATGEAAGVVRLHADPGHDEAEYAILLRSDLKGVGLGWTLMTLIIEWARAEGLKTIRSQVLTENKRMLALCRQLGFAIAHDPDDPALSIVTLPVDSGATTLRS